ncbi:Uncharacterised protein [Mycobacteroides abscessus subsp. abscessus]|nr:Uncharacterised protein [Mycobacteroides abscessus subsp. abscessus]
MIEKRGTDEESAFMTVDREIAAVQDQLGPLGDADVDVVAHPLEGVGTDQRTEVDTLVQRGADHQLAGTLGQAVDQPLGGGFADGYRNGDGHTALTGRAVSRADQRIDRLVDIRVRHDDHVVLGAAKALGAFAVGGGGLVDVLRDRGGADEPDGGDARIVQ